MTGTIGKPCPSVFYLVRVDATFLTPCTRACARHACRSNIDGTAAAATELFGRVYVQSRYCFAARRPRRGSKQYLSHAPPSLRHPSTGATHHPAGSLLQKPLGERGAPRGGAGRRGGLLRPSVSSRLVSRDGLVSRQPSSVRIDTPATLTTPTSSTFYCEKQCTYRPPRPLPPPPTPSFSSSSSPAPTLSPPPRESLLSLALLFLLSLWLLPPASAR